MSGTSVPALPQRNLPNAASSKEVAPAGLEHKRAVAPTALPPILSSKPTIWGLLSAFRRRWRLAVGLGLLVGAIAAASAWYLTNATSYTVSTTLHVGAMPPKVFFNTQPDERINYQTYQAIQMGAVKRRLVLNSALGNPKVKDLAIVREQDDPLEWLSKEVQVDFSSGPETMRISMIGKDHESLVILLDAIREAYLREEANKEQNQRGVHLRQLEDLQQEFEKKLRDKRKIVDQLAKDVGGKNDAYLAKRQENQLIELNRMNMELLDLQSQLRRALLETTSPLDDKAVQESVRDRWAMVAGDIWQAVDKAVQEGVIPEATIEEAVRQDPFVVGYEKDIALREQKLAVYRERVDHPEKDGAYKQMQTELEAVKKLLAARRAELVPKIIEELRKQFKLQTTREQAKQQARIANMKQMIKGLDELIAKQMDRNQDFGKKTIDLGTQKEEIELVEQVWKKMGAEVEALRVEIQAPARVTTEEPAFATKRASFGLKAALGSGFGGFALVLLGISFLEFRARRLADTDEVSQGLRLPVVGTMPRMRARNSRTAPQSGNGQAADSQQLLIESVDAARAVILHASKENALRVVMITSAVGGEGKTMLSAHLSASMARAGWRALLVDADFRRPSLQTVFGLQEQAGLSEVLRGEADLRAVMQPGPMDGLSVISAGQCDSRSMQALAQGAMRGLFDQIKEEFDLIIVDSAPVLPVVDSQLIAQAVDGVILSVLRDVSRLPLIHAAYERLMFFQVNLLGVVVHGADGGTYGFQYPYQPVPAAKAATPTNPE